MSIIRNRELSQFGSFIFVDNASENIAITEGALPYVGIGTTSPQYKLDVLGDTRIQGNLEASSYTLDGNPLVDATIEYWKFGTGGDDIYRLQGNVGIGTSVFTEKLTVNGNVSAGQFVSTAANGTPPFEVSSLTLVTHLNADYLRGKIPPSGDIVGSTDSQILTNKTINLSNNTLTGTAAQFNSAVSDNDFVTLTDTQTLTNKTLTSPTITSIVNSGTKTVPTGTGTFVITGSTGTVTSGMIAEGTVVNADISSSAAIAISKLAESTISGISLGNNLNSLTAGSYITYNSGTTYNGSVARTIGVAGTSNNTSNTLVARNTSGDFTAGTITASVFNATTTDAFRVSGTTVINSGRNIISVVNGNFSGIVTANTFSGTTGSFSGTVSANTFSGTTGSFSGTVTATDFNSTSDVNLKTNINTVENSLDTVSKLRGVSFDWKETGKSSYGVIAQELEEILPELVNSGDVKSVNYNGIIGVLIEAVKELSTEVAELKKKLINN